MNVNEFLDDNETELGIDPTYEEIIRVVHELKPLSLFDLSVELSTLDVDAMAVSISEALVKLLASKKVVNRMIEKMRYV